MSSPSENWLKMYLSTLDLLMQKPGIEPGIVLTNSLGHSDAFQSLRSLLYEGSRWQRSKASCSHSCSHSPINTSKKKNLKWFVQNILWTLAKETKPPKRRRNSWHKWGKQKEKKRAREKRNQDGISNPEREKWKRKGAQMLGSHLADREISRDRGTSKSPWKAQQLDWGGQSRMRVTQIIS